MKIIIPLLLAFIVFGIGLGFAYLLDTAGADPMAFWVAGIIIGALIMACLHLGD